MTLQQELQEVIDAIENYGNPEMTAYEWESRFLHVKNLALRHPLQPLKAEPSDRLRIGLEKLLMCRQAKVITQVSLVLP